MRNRAASTSSLVFNGARQKWPSVNPIMVAINTPPLKLMTNNMSAYASNTEMPYRRVYEKRKPTLNSAPF